MNVKSTIQFIAAAFIIATAGCASTIGNVTDLDSATFQIGSTNKSEIADYLGFPSSRETEAGLEYWGYSRKPELTGLMYALPTGANTVTTFTTTNTRVGPIRMDSAAVIYTFDEAGTLIDVFENDQD